MSYLTRRQVLGIALAGLSLKFARAADTDQSRMIVRSPFPTDFEMPLDGFTEAITPIDHFFVRCHTNIPKVNLKTWSLKVDGVVNRPLTLTMDELRKLPRTELVGVLECAGNNRAFYQPHVAGTQWSYGGAGNGRWAGVRLRDVLEETGVKSSAKQVLFNGADTPLGTMEHLRRGITVEKALHPDTLLAYELNGQPLPVMHGFPVRIVVPGWAGDSWIKWLQHIEVLDHEHDGFWMKSAYRYPKSTVNPGATVNPADTVPVTSLGVKSVIAKPAAGPMTANSVTIAGAAWSDGSPVTGVDVSTDGGQHWTSATLGKDLGRYSWRLWEFDWTPGPEGQYMLMSRAHTASGAVQPLEQQWNPGGYLWNVTPRVSVQVGPESYRRTCFVCHDGHMMQTQRLTRAQWEKEVGKMGNWGARVNPEDRESIIDFLSGTFK